MNCRYKLARILRKIFERLAWSRAFLLMFALLAVFLALKTPTAKSGGGTFPGANGKIAFMSDRDGDSEIYTMNPDGTGLTQLTANSVDDRFPAFSADGTKIAFASTRDGNWEIYVMNADGTTQTRLTNNPAEEQSPNWSPDGTKIAFSSNRDGNAEIYVMNTDGSNPTNLTNNPADDYIPVWSPHGAKIVFQSTRDDPSFEIYTMNADGTAQTRLTTAVFTQDVEPAWSPEGTKIIWRKDPGGYSSADLWFMNSDGSSQARMLDGLGFEGEGVYSPDGTKIVFNSTSDGNIEIYVMNADTSGQVRLTFDLGQDSDLNWQPIVSPIDCATPPPGLVSWWPGDGNANDIQGGNNGTLLNGATFATGFVGQAFSFDGDNDYVQVTNASSLQFGTSDFTIDFWAKIISPTTKTQTFITTQAVHTDPPGILISNRPDVGGILFDIRDGVNVRTIKVPLQLDEDYHHFAFVRRGSVLEGHVDGFEVSTVLNEIGDVPNMNSPAPLLLGRTGLSSLFGFFYDGAIDELEISNRALSAAEIQSIFNARSAGKCKNRTPVAICQDVTVTSNPDGTAGASINNGSFDPDIGDSITLTQSPVGPYPLGQTIVTLTVEDNHGAFSSCQAVVTVLYNFGFFGPVDNLPTINVVNAGSAIPVKFSLNGNKGLNIFAFGYPVSQQIACSDGAPVSTVEETVTAGNSSISYDATTDQYTYVWKTNKSWKDTCRQLILKLNDSSIQVANFQFR